MLKKIEIKGFKSFADKTTIDFEKGITCIVGPNGSGKSNITDAFRWVLGEQSYKSLRGSQMSDVIFNGTVTRAPLGYAEVCVVLDNNDGSLALPYSEISIVRKLYRSGESEYSINGNVCRLKDVKELFVDTGIGVEGYSIIGQGRISKLLSSGKDERRLIFEEASGIVKYRAKKKDAERKLDKSEQHIERLEDIILELESRLAPLKEQSDKANEHNRIMAELRGVEVSLYLYEIDKIKADLEAYNAELAKIEEESETLTGKLLAFKEGAAKTSSELDESRGVRSNLIQNRTELEKQRIELLGNLDLLKERLETADKLIGDIKKERESLSEGSDELETKMSESEEKLKALREDYSVKEAKQNDLKEEFDLKNSDLISKESKLALIKSSKIKDGENLEAINLRRAELNGKRDLSISMRKILDSEISEGTKIKDDAFVRLQDVQSRISESEADLQEAQKNKSDMETFVAENRRLIESSENDMFDLKSKLNKAVSDLEVLEEKIHGFESMGESTASVMKKSYDDSRVLGTIGSLIEIEQRFEIALEQILGRRIENVVTTSFDTAREYIKYLKKESAGRVTFMPLDTLRPKDVIDVYGVSGMIGPAMDFIDCDDSVEPAIRYLLFNVGFAEDLISAKNAQRDLPNGYKIVTLSGDVVNVGGSVSGGSSKKKTHGVFQEKREMDRLKGLINEYDSKLRTLESQRDSLIKQVRESVQEIALSEKKIDDLKNTHSEHRLSLDIVRREISEGINMENSKQKQFEENEFLITEIESKLKLLDEEEKETLRLRAERDSGTEELKLAIEEKRLEVEGLKNLINDEKIKLMSLGFELKEAEGKLNILRETSDKRNSDFERLDRNFEQVSLQRTTVLKDIEDKNLQIEENSFDHEKVNKEISEVESKIRDLKSKNSENINLYRDLESRMSELKDEMYAIRINTNKLETRWEVQTQGLWNDYNTSYAGAQEYRIDIDYKEAKKAVRVHKRDLADLGEVNQLSIKEYEEVSERYEFLASQKADLLETSKKLNKIIREMDMEMRTRFKESITDINKKFGETFRGLFRGGTASIEISEDEDILEAEINVNAQPPGKKLQTLELLSGGEKALTAIAILFAILKTKPAPFCVLDEIESALDDRNIALFSSFLKDYIEKSQFIIITHRKGTMEIADAIYGVTMKEKGVTGMLSLKLTDNAEKMLGIS